jgi:hypothetical protein
MKKQTYTAKVTKVEARHFSRRNLSGTCAKMSLWAETELGDEVWLLTHKGIGTRRVKTKIEELEKEYEFMLGQEINYIIKPGRGWHLSVGFLTPRGITPEDYRPLSFESQNQRVYVNAGEGI